MDLLTTNVVVLEGNRTRAELYALWLDAFDVSVCLTKQEAETAIDRHVAVAVLNEEFGDDSAETVLAVIRDVAPASRVIATRNRSSAFPALGVEHQLTEPVFEDDLADLVETLVFRTNYHMLLQMYYRLSVKMVPYETTGATDTEEYELLEQRVVRFRRMLNSLRQELTSDDVTKVLSDITIQKFETVGEKRKVDSKYRPDDCANCTSDQTDDDTPQFTRLGAYVWRCTACGYVQMHIDPSHQSVSSYRK